MSGYDDDLERLLADTDAELPPPPAQKLDFERLRAQRLRRRGVAGTLGIVGFASLWSLTMSASGIGPTPTPTPTHPTEPIAAVSPASDPATEVVRSLHAAVRGLKRRLQQDSARASEHTQSSLARDRQRRCDLQLRSRLAEVRADAAIAYTRIENNKR